VDQVQERIAGVGAADDAENLFKMLDGSSFQAGLVKLVLGLMKMMPGVQTMGKVAMMEMLGRADDLLNAVPQMEKIGKLRQSTTPEAGKSYWMAFSNRGRLVKHGDHVIVQIGQFRADGLVVD